MSFSQSPDSQIMQQQMDWLLLRLINTSHNTPEATSDAVADGATAPAEGVADANGDHSSSPAASQPLPVGQAQHMPDSQERGEETGVEPEMSDEQVKQVESMSQQLQLAQTELGHSEAAAAEAPTLQKELAQLQSRLIESEQQAAQSQQLAQQVSVLQSDLKAAQDAAGALQQQLDNSTKEARAQGQDRALHSRSSSRSEMDLSISRSESQQEMDQPSTSIISIVEADLIEAASNAIQAQASGSSHAPSCYLFSVHLSFYLHLCWAAQVPGQARQAIAADSCFCFEMRHGLDVSPC